MRTAAIRQELLTSRDANLQRRRKIMLLSALGVADFAFLSLYQAGAINRLPELPLKAFDSNKVNAAPDAYQMGVPDAAVSALIYAGNLVLASAGGTQVSGRKAWLDAALGATVAANAVGAVYYLADMTLKQKKVCPYCIAGAVINLASAAIVVPLVRNVLGKWFR